MVVGGCSLKEGHTDPIVSQLKEASRTTGVHWAVILLKTGENWKLHATTGLVRAQQATLKTYIQEADTNAWLCGAAAVGRCRWRNIAAHASGLPGKKLYLYPAQDLAAVIMVSADELHGAASGVWRVLASSLASKLTLPPEMQPVHASAGRSARHLQLINQVLTCMADGQSARMRIKEAVFLVAAYYQDGLVELVASINGEEFTFSSGEMPKDALVSRASLTTAGQACGSLYVAVPQSRRTSTSDQLLVQILAQIFSMQLALA